MTGEPVILDERALQELLVQIRDHTQKIRSGWANPQYGTCIEEETRNLLDAFEKLDESLSAGSQYPTGWR
jgi:hypothetical protein